jgi:hypothetical protein
MGKRSHNILGRPMISAMAMTGLVAPLAAIVFVQRSRLGRTQ